MYTYDVVHSSKDERQESPPFHTPYREDCKLRYNEGGIVSEGAIRDFSDNAQASMYQRYYQDHQHIASNSPNSSILSSIPDESNHSVTELGQTNLPLEMRMGQPYVLTSSLEVQTFDETTSVDLQQLFPSNNNAIGGTMPSINTFYTTQTHPTSELLTEAAASISSFHSADRTNVNMMVPFPLLSNAMYQDTQNPMEMNALQNVQSIREEDSSELQDMTQIFTHQPSLMTPPTSTLTPRTSIVSPIHTFSTSLNSSNNVGLRSVLLPPPLRDGEIISMDSKFSPDRRKLCCVEGCKSQARAFNRCKRHGGSKRCAYQNCTKSVQSRGLCIRHGGGSRCQELDCTRAAQSQGKCKMHGGGRPCVVPGCDKKAHLKRLCRKHGGGAKCSLESCDKWAQRQGMCMTHSKRSSSSSALLVQAPAMVSTETETRQSSPLFPDMQMII